MISIKTTTIIILCVLLSIVSIATQLTFETALTDTGVSTAIPALFVVAFTACILFLGQSNGTNKKSKLSKQQNEFTNSTTPVVNSNGEISTLYIGNLAYKANEKTVHEHFARVGEVKSVRLVKDRKTGRRKGFGFVEVPEALQQHFIDNLNETEFMERNIIVRQANEKQH